MRGCDIARSWTPASGIGGDCYDVLRFSDDRVAVSIADVVGKGLPAALLMSNLQAAVRAFATASAAPHDVCTSVNRLLCRNIASGKFVTFCYAVVDTGAATVTYANAGHFPPVLVHADGRTERLASDRARAGRRAGLDVHASAPRASAPATGWSASRTASPRRARPTATSSAKIG